MAYTKKVEIQALATSADEIGQVVQNWETVLTAWAETENTGGREYYSAKQTNSEDDFIFKVRYSRKIADFQSLRKQNPMLRQIHLFMTNIRKPLNEKPKLTKRAGKSQLQPKKAFTVQQSTTKSIPSFICLNSVTSTVTELPVHENFRTLQMPKIRQIRNLTSLSGTYNYGT